MGTMGIKQTTKAFGQTAEKPISGTDIANTISAKDKDKIGGENVGDVLNKLADANYVDPSKKIRTVGNDKLDKDAFFKLMLAQMKNQDPTNPLKPHEMSAQMANFGALEQMQNINVTLTEMKAAQKPQEQFQALNLIGKGVAGDSAQLVRTKGDKEHDFRFTLPQAAAGVSIKVKNGDGDVVRTYDLKNLKDGDNKITWNGLDDKGNKARPDSYSFVAEATNAAGQKLAVKTAFDGVITGVNYTPEGPVLLVGNQTVRLSDVKKIIDPSLMKNDQNVPNATSQDLKAPGAAPQTGINSKDEESEPAKSNILKNVGLSREMMDRLQKETKPGG